MPDPYQRGDEGAWAAAEADELRHQLKKRTNQLYFERMMTTILIAGFGWVIFKFLQDHKLEELWKM